MRTKNPEIYEILTLFVGFFGLNRLYTGEPGIAAARLMCVACAVLLTYTAFSLLSAPIAVAAAAFYTLLFACWIADYFALSRLHHERARDRQFL
jgi:TM2 domain-containing membrane protein YozV